MQRFIGENDSATITDWFPIVNLKKGTGKGELNLELEISVFGASQDKSEKSTEKSSDKSVGDLDIPSIPQISEQASPSSPHVRTKVFWIHKI